MKSFEIEQRIRKQALEEGKAVGLEEGKAVGLAEGIAKSILDLLGDLGEIPPALQDKISAQKDEATLRVWLKVAAKAESLQNFGEQILLKEQ